MVLPRYSDSVISDVFAANDIIEYVSKYVALQKRGNDYTGLCPFHNEKTPSFHVSADKQLFYCFGCGAGGNLAQFVMRSENVDFVDAIKILADNAGIALPEENNSYDDERHKKRLRIYEMNAKAARFFHDSLMNVSGKQALEYLVGRGINPNTITAYGIGYAPKGYDSLLNFLRNKGYSDKEIIEASLANEKDGRVYDKFRDRVMFPIIDVRGNVIGFGGRIFKESDPNSEFKPPKYLNSGETIAFDKGKNLFSLNYAKKVNSRKIILVEGYMDVISVYQAGIKNIVATLGTALTENQAKLISKYASEVLICYDMDEAGRKAALKAVDIFAAIGVKTRIVKLKGAKDPDEYIKKSGVAMFKKALDESVPSTEFKLSLIRLDYNIAETDGKIAFVTAAAKVLSTIKEPIEVDAYINKLVDETGIGKEAIYAEYRKNAVASSNSNEYKKIRTAKKTSNSDKITAEVDAERRLLNLVASDRQIYNVVKDILSPEDFTEETFAKAAELIYSYRERGIEPDAAEIMNYFSDNEASMSVASSIFYELSEYKDKKITAEENVRVILLAKNNREMKKYESDIQKLGELIIEQNYIKKLKLQWDGKDKGN